MLHHTRRKREQCCLATHIIGFTIPHPRVVHLVRDGEAYTGVVEEFVCAKCAMCACACARSFDARVCARIAVRAGVCVRALSQTRVSRHPPHTRETCAALRGCMRVLVCETCALALMCARRACYATCACSSACLCLSCAGLCETCALRCVCTRSCVREVCAALRCARSCVRCARCTSRARVCET
jgi:hypothetical protein